MPLYEYKCSQCDREVEVLVRGAERPTCPECGDDELQRLLSVPAAHTGARGSLDVCPPMPQGGCGLPQCGSSCQFE